MAFSLMRGKPSWVTDLRTAEFSRVTESLAREWRPDLVQLEYHVMGQYLPALQSCDAPRVLVEHEPAVRATIALSRIARVLNPLERSAWRRFEPEVLREVQAAVVFSENDRKAITMLAPGTRAVRIPLGVDMPEQAMNPVGAPSRNLLFFGNFRHPPNVDAAARMARFIFPRLEQRFPDLELYIVGDRPPLSLKWLARDKVHVPGRVPDLAPFIDRASVIVAPLRLGGGMRVKVLEVLAAGKALVASPLALEGLTNISPTVVFEAETDCEFRCAIADLLTNQGKRSAMAHAARVWAGQNLPWGKSIAAYEALYTELLEAMPPADTMATPAAGPAKPVAPLFVGEERSA